MAATSAFTITAGTITGENLKKIARGGCPERQNVTEESMPGFSRAVFIVPLIAGFSYGQDAQAPQWPPPLPTKLEAFQPTPGAVFSVGHENLGNVGGVIVEVREMRDSKSKPVRGLIVTINTERSFVDADELAGLLRGCDALLEVTSNPTAFKGYEARYTTKGSLELAAETSEDRGVTYSVKVGRFRTAASGQLSPAQMAQLREIFATAAEKISALPD